MTDRALNLPTSFADRSGGIIATLSDGHVMHTIGTRRESLRAIADECDRRGVTVRSLSTPQTIFRDLQGSRDDHRHSAGYSGESPEHITLPERSLLGYIGRRDLAP